MANSDGGNVIRLNHIGLKVQGLLASELGSMASSWDELQGYCFPQTMPETGLGIPCFWSPKPSCPAKGRDTTNYENRLVGL
jgi:hypothetical protein